jgi:hypothetical protein
MQMKSSHAPFGVLIESTPPIVVERSVYTSGNGAQ